jgi:hypothetical protein
MNIPIDVSDIVSTILVPSLVIHRTDDKIVNVEAGRFLAQHIRGAGYSSFRESTIFPLSATMPAPSTTQSRSF